MAIVLDQKNDGVRYYCNCVRPECNMVKIHAGNKGWRVLVINKLTMYILNPEILSKFSHWGGSKIMICHTRV